MLRTALHSSFRPAACLRLCSSTPAVPPSKTSSPPSKTVSPPRSDNPLLRELCAKIRFGGPIPIAQYMNEALINPKHGYYTWKENVLGTKGDFITSPEISQMFGECIGIWILNEWFKMLPPDAEVNLVELGPGRGTLMDDILRTISKVSPQGMKGLNVHFVEVSKVLRKAQRAKLCGYGTKATSGGDDEDGTNLVVPSKFGPSIHWHPDLRSVPKGFSFFIAHEFFDALPINQFVRSEDPKKRDWQEVLVDVAPGSDHKLRFVRSNNSTPTATLIDSAETRNLVELCPQAGVHAKRISERVAQYGGAALITDYGHDGDKVDGTFRAFHGHKLHDPLENPGTADLTADVDFSYLRRHCSDQSIVHGPVTQNQFLHRLGIQVRADRLLEQYKEEDPRRKDLLTSYEELTKLDRMGERFKFMAIFPKSMKEIHEKVPPAGFEKT